MRASGESGGRRGGDHPDMRIRVLFVTGVFLASTLSLGAIPQTHSEGAKASSDPGVLFASGQMALQNGNLDGAEKAFRQVLAIDPNAAGAYSNLGVIAMRRKDWDQALKLLGKAEKLAPKVSGVRLNIGLVYYREGDYAAAIPPLSSVLKDQPDSEQARYLLGLCNLFVQNYANAASVLEPLWPQKSNDFMYLYVLSITSSEAGRKELEEKALNRLVEVGGDTPEFHLLLGKAYLNRQETEKATAELERAASVNPNLPFVHFNLGICYARTGDNNHAEAEFRREIALEPDLPDTYELLGEFYLRAGKQEEAEKNFREALQRNSRMGGSHFGIAKIRLYQEKYQQALAEIDTASRLAPDSQGVHNLRGQILSKLGRKEEAQAEFARVKKMTDANYSRDVESFSEGRVPNPELTRQPPP
jgi:Flp pilus assembly protein TadD